MSTQFVTVSSSDPLAAAAQRMLDHRLHHLLVIDERKLVGIVTAFDLLPRLATQAPHDSRSSGLDMR